MYIQFETDTHPRIDIGQYYKKNIIKIL